MKKIKINYGIIRDIIILFPFFELLTFEILAQTNQNSNLCDIILTIYSLLRIILTGYALVRIKKISCNISLIGFTLFVLIENFASAINGTLYFRYLVGSLTIIGLILNCEIMIRKSINSFVESCYILFGFLSFNGLMSVFIWPNGFFNAEIKAYAIYFLGSKNTAFFYFIVFLYFMIFRDLQRYGKPQIKRSGWILLFILSSIVSDAVNSLILFGFFGIIYIWWCRAGKMVLYVNYRFLVPFIFLIALFILIAPIRNLCTPFFQLLGRDATFTGRDVLWEQAIIKFLKHPFWGNGITTTFLLETGAIATHAHSHYLDTIAKYGILAFVTFVMTVIMVINNYLKDLDRQYIVLNSLILGIILTHSIVDHLMTYNFALILVAINQLSGERRKCIKN